MLPLLVQAIDDIAYALAGEGDHERAMHILRELMTQEHNRISYQNITVMEQEGQVAGILIAYAGMMRTVWIGRFWIGLDGIRTRSMHW